MNKKTEELINELLECKSIENYVDENREQFLDYTLTEYLNMLLRNKCIRKIDVVRQSCQSETYVYQIFDGKRGNPDRDKLICIARAMQLDLKETDRVLKVSGKSELYAKDRRDSVIIFAVNKGLNIHGTNDLLFELGERTLI